MFIEYPWRVKNVEMAELDYKEVAEDSPDYDYDEDDDGK